MKEKREKKATNEMDKLVETLLLKGKDLTESDIETAFPGLSSDISDIIVDISKSSQCMIDRECTHIWYNKDSCKQDVYTGAFVDFKRKKYIIEYWFHDSPEDTHFSELFPKQVITDIIRGDMILS